MPRFSPLASRALLTLALLAFTLHADESKIGDFDAQSDVGTVAPPGTATFDKATSQYTLTSTGENIWAKKDDFHFLYRKTTGDVTLTADVTLIGEGKVPHRKAGLMFRQGLETDDPYVDVVVHGDNSIGLQYRLKKGDITAGVKPTDLKAPATLRLERHGDTFTAYAAPKSATPPTPADFKLVGTIKADLKDPVYTGLVLSAHDPKAVESATFSNVTLKPGEK